MKIPEARATADKEWEKLEKLPAWKLTKVRTEKGHESKKERFQLSEDYNDSQTKIGWTEETCDHLDKIAAQDHSYKATRVERMRNKHVFGSCLWTAQAATVQWINGLTMPKTSEKKNGYIKNREKNVPTSIPVSKLDRDTTAHSHRHWTVTWKLIRKLNWSGTQAHQAHRVLGDNRRDKHVETRRLKSGIRGAGLSGSSFFLDGFLVAEVSFTDNENLCNRRGGGGGKRKNTVSHTSPHWDRTRELFSHFCLVQGPGVARDERSLIACVFQKQFRLSRARGLAASVSVYDFTYVKHITCNLDAHSELRTNLRTLQMQSIGSMAEMEAPTTGAATSEIRKEIQELLGTRDQSKVLIVFCVIRHRRPRFLSRSKQQRTRTRLCSV